MTEEEQALRHLARYEKKNVVKGWNKALASGAAERLRKQDELHHQQQQQLNADSDDDSSDEDGDLVAATDPSHLEPSDRLIQWLRQESAPVSTAVSSQWELQFANFNQHAEAEGGEEEIPLTSGQVKHAYRTRARKEEIQQTKRSVVMKLQREKLLGLQTTNNSNSSRDLFNRRRQASQNSTQVALVVKRSTRNSGSHTLKTERSPQAPTQLQPPAHASEELDHDERVFELKNLPASRMCVDSELRNETLAVIRKELIVGRNVLLTSDCGSIAAEAENGDSLSDTKLMMQQLCTQSLMFCVREQEVVPEVDFKQQRVRLFLLSRMPWLN